MRTRSHGRRTAHRTAERQDGQALVEFSVAVIPFLILLMGVVDLGRGIYALNGTSQAAREIARTTSVHPREGFDGPFGMSSDTLEVIAIQRGLIPGLAVDPDTDIVCVDELDQVIADDACRPDDYVRVSVEAPFSPITPLVSAFGDHTFTSVSRIRIP